MNECIVDYYAIVGMVVLALIVIFGFPISIVKYELRIEALEKRE